MKPKVKQWKFLISLLLLSHNSISQGIDNLWLMGYLGGGGSVNFDFSGGNLIVDSFARKMSFNATDASISDKNGNILFYTNGIWIANSLNDTMQNGSGIDTGYLANQFQQFGLPITQGAFIIPKPGDSTKYYIFHETVNDIFTLSVPTELMHTVVDLSLDSGLGAAIQKNSITINDTMEFGEITGVKHGNGRDWWLLTHKHQEQLFCSSLIGPAGISPPALQTIGLVRQSGIQAAFSSDGTMYASYNTLDDLEIFAFNRCTGLLSNYTHIDINDSMVGGGLAFSPNCRYLYASSVLYVYQFDLLASNIAASKQTVAVWDGTYSPAPPFAANFFLMQLAPDGKIYINCCNSTLDMHVINYPDSAGLACDLQQHSIHLPAFNAFSIPNYPNYFLGRDLGSPCDSLTDINTYTSTVIPIRVTPQPGSKYILS